MAKIVIDTKVWVTQAEYARRKKVTTQAVHNWIARGKIDAWYIKEIDLQLVKVGSENSSKIS